MNVLPPLKKRVLMEKSIDDTARAYCVRWCDVHRKGIRMASA